MPIPFVVGGLARLGLGGVAKRFAGRALRWATRGRLIGAGGGAAAARRVGGLAVGAATTYEVAKQLRRPGETRGPNRKDRDPYGGEEYSGRRYRRMNPMNVRALRRSVRRINSAEKLFRKVFTITKGQVNVRKPRRSN